MKKQYTQPELYVENVVVESGIALSFTPQAADYGDDNAAGADGSVSTFSWDL